jgi:succinate-semialdehyde dehydrogenase / glutarate-semialdehyde dehydrogenase
MESMILDGERRESSSGAVLDVVNPATSEIFEQVPDASADDAAEALRIASNGRIAWARTPLHLRIAAVQRFLAILSEGRDQLARLVTLETGKPLREAYEEVDDTFTVFKGFCECAAAAMFGMAAQLDMQPGLESDYLVTRREPLGVIVAILPFNFPIEMYAHKVAPALLAGNVVVAKPSEDTPLSSLLLTEWLLEAGVPADALQCLTGRGETVGAALVSSSSVNGISMTGSTEVGARIYQSGARNLARVFLELGGNDPLLVMADADLDLAVDMAVLGRTLCAGQCCSANKRLLVDQAVYDDFVHKLLRKLEGIMPGDPLAPDTSLGTLISANAATRAAAQVKRTVAAGARLELGGDVAAAAFAPTVLLDVTKDMEIAQDMEIFAPVFPIIATGTEREMVAIANNTVYGLSASVFTRDYERAFTISTRIECGLVVVNGTSLYRPLIHQHGGYKRSGIGREGFDITIREMTQNKGIAFRAAVSLS